MYNCASFDNGDTITNPYDIANTLNNYFASIAETTKQQQQKFNIFTSTFSNFHLSNESISIIFLQPTDKEEITSIISSLISNKASDPNSVPYRTLFFLKNEAIVRLIQPLFYD